ncbi:hypothetical protein EP7_001832 [Isosphaeraceae bacterium EP7]
MNETIPTGEDVKRPELTRSGAAASNNLGSLSMPGWTFGLEPLKCVIPGLPG